MLHPIRILLYRYRSPHRAVFILITSRETGKVRGIDINTAMNTNTNTMMISA